MKRKKIELIVELFQGNQISLQVANSLYPIIELSQRFQKHHLNNQGDQPLSTCGEIQPEWHTLVTLGVPWLMEAVGQPESLNIKFLYLS